MHPVGMSKDCQNNNQIQTNTAGGPELEVSEFYTALLPFGREFETLPIFPIVMVWHFCKPVDPSLPVTLRRGTL